MLIKDFIKFRIQYRRYSNEMKIENDLYMYNRISLARSGIYVKFWNKYGEQITHLALLGLPAYHN